MFRQLLHRFLTLDVGETSVTDDYGIRLSNINSPSDNLLLAMRNGRASVTLTSRLRPTYEQKTILYMLAVFSVLTVLMHQFSITRIIIYPFSILSTIFHEAGHALACLLTGGRMEQIQIAMDESGATRFRGGWLCFILPAGYVGSTLSGALLVFAAFGRKTARISAVCVAAILLFTLVWAGSVYTIVCSTSLTLTLILLVTHRGGIFCRHVIALIGSVCTLQACLSILNSTVFHTVEGSDAVVFSRECSVLVPAFVYGLVWLLLSFALLLISLFSAIVIFK